MGVLYSFRVPVAHSLFAKLSLMFMEYLQTARFAFDNKSLISHDSTVGIVAVATPDDQSGN